MEKYFKKHPDSTVDPNFILAGRITRGIQECPSRIPNVSSSPCLMWDGCERIWLLQREQQVRITRLIYEYCFGAIPNDHQLLQLCRAKKDKQFCIQPEHLALQQVIRTFPDPFQEDITVDDLSKLPDHSSTDDSPPPPSASPLVSTIDDTLTEEEKDITKTHYRDKRNAPELDTDTEGAMPDFIPESPRPYDSDTEEFYPKRNKEQPRKRMRTLETIETTSAPNTTCDIDNTGYDSTISSPYCSCDESESDDFVPKVVYECDNATINNEHDTMQIISNDITRLVQELDSVVNCGDGGRGIPIQTKMIKIPMTTQKSAIANMTLPRCNRVKNVVYKVFTPDNEMMKLAQSVSTKVATRTKKYVTTSTSRIPKSVSSSSMVSVIKNSNQRNQKHAHVAQDGFKVPHSYLTNFPPHNRSTPTRNVATSLNNATNSNIVIVNSKIT